MEALGGFVIGFIVALIMRDKPIKIEFKQSQSFNGDYIDLNKIKGDPDSDEENFQDDVENTVKNVMSGIEGVF